jgi:tetratricopeptide (TPR) repeat protein
VGAAVARFARRSRLGEFCALSFLVTLLPVLQVVPNGYMHAADRYFYIPSVALLVLAGAGLDRLAGSVSRRWLPWLRIAAVALLLVLGALTWRRLGVWRDGVAIWDDVLTKYPRSALVLLNRGAALAAQGAADRALADYNAALGLGGNPTMRSRILFDRGRLRHDRGDLLAAIEDYTESLRLDPGYAEALVNRGNALDAVGRREEAVADYAEALRLDPDNDLARYNRGVALRARGDLARALADFDAALRLNPWHAASWFNRAVVRATLGQFPEALEDLDRAAALRPGDAETFQVRGQVRRRLGDERGAREDHTKAGSLVAKPTLREPMPRR